MLAAATTRWRWRPGFGAVLLSLLFFAHFFCAAGALDSAAAAETIGDGGAVAESAAAVAADPAAAPDSDSDSESSEKHHMCQADPGAGPDQRTAAVAAALLLGLGPGTILPQAARSPSVLWRPPAALGRCWSGARLLFSLCVQRV